LVRGNGVVRSPTRAVRPFYEQYLGLKRSDAGPPHAVVFDTRLVADPDGYQVTLHDRG